MKQTCKHAIIKASHWSLKLNSVLRQRKALMTRCWGWKNKRCRYNGIENKRTIVMATFGNAVMKID